MIFSPEGNFNLGGCHAVLRLMESGFTNSKYVTEDGRMQIIKIVNKLIYDKQFLALFTEEFEVDNEMQGLILIDMKLPKEDKFHFRYVQWGILMLLFNPVRQLEEPNCFAVLLLLI